MLDWQWCCVIQSIPCNAEQERTLLGHYDTTRSRYANADDKLTVSKVAARLRLFHRSVHQMAELIIKHVELNEGNIAALASKLNKPAVAKMAANSQLKFKEGKPGELEGAFMISRPHFTRKGAKERQFANVDEYAIQVQW